MGFIAENYGIEQTSPLMTDKYHLTTAYAYWLEGRADNPSIFYMFGRKEAVGSGYTVAAGLEGVIDIVQRWQEHGFTKADLDFLKPQFPPAFIDYLAGMKFKLKIDAAPEGTVFFPQEPVLRVSGPIAQVKMLESVALCLFNGHGAYATHAARQISVIEEEMDNGSPTGTASIQGLRRGPGLGAAIEASRSLGLGGYQSTSTGTAAKLFGQAFVGTMDHAWVMTHRRELGDITLTALHGMSGHEQQDALAGDAFRSFAFAYPDSGILLVDTYDPLQGLEHAITVIKELRAMGSGQHYGVRFDSGDIVAYSRHALRRFAEEGFVTSVDPAKVAFMDDADLLKHAKDATVFCAAADGIDEYTAQEMRAAGGFFRAWGIGTAGSHVPPLGLVYKASSFYMSSLQDDKVIMTPVMKVAAHAPVKSSNPGCINARRFYDAQGMLSHVVIYDEDLGLSKTGEAVNLRNFEDVRVFDAAMVSKTLLTPIFDQDGTFIYHAPKNIGMITQLLQKDLNSLPSSVKRVQRSERDLLCASLMAKYKNALKSGADEFTVSLDDLKSSIAEQPAHIPVFLDMNLFRQRQACEKKHLLKSNNAGVQVYEERFEQLKRASS